MSKALDPNATRVNYHMPPEVIRALEAHRKRLSRERGYQVSRADAARDAILRTKGAS